MTDREYILKQFRDASRRRGAIRNALDARLAEVVQRIDNGTITEVNDGKR